jgi:hypothetical protein
MDLRSYGRFLVGALTGVLVALMIARRTADRAVFDLQRGPTVIALVLGGLGGGICAVLMSKGHSKAALITLLVTGMLLGAVVLSIQLNVAGAGF